jgi:hypothetical protein
MPQSKHPTHRLYCEYGDNQRLTVDVYGISDLRDWFKKLSEASIKHLTLSVLYAAPLENPHSVSILS